jgi:hypothetical protein
MYHSKTGPAGNGFRSLAIWAWKIVSLISVMVLVPFAAVGMTDTVGKIKRAEENITATNAALVTDSSC